MDDINYVHLRDNGLLSGQNSSNATEREMMTIVSAIDIGTATLSIFGSSSVILFALYRRKICWSEIFPIFLLSVADLLASVCILLSAALLLTSWKYSPQREDLCEYISTFTMCFFVSTFFLTMCYALEAFLRVRRRMKAHTAADGRMFKVIPGMFVMYVLSWLLPAAGASALLIVTHVVDKVTRKDTIECRSCFPVFHYNKAECWESTSTTSYEYVYKVVFLVPLIFCMVVNIILYTCTWVMFRKFLRKRGVLGYNQRKEEMNIRNKAIVYQAVFAVCWLPSLIIAGISIANPSFSITVSSWPYVLQAICAPLQGFLNCIVYGWKRRGFRTAISEKWRLVANDSNSYQSVSL